MRRNKNVIGFTVASFAVVSVVVKTKYSYEGLYRSYFSSYAGTCTAFLGVTSDPSSSQTNSAFPSFIAVIFILSIDDAEMFTSEMHDPYTRITVAWKTEQHKNTFKGHRCGAGQTPSEG